MDRKEPLVRQSRFSAIKHARVAALRCGADCMGKRADYGGALRRKLT